MKSKSKSRFPLRIQDSLRNWLDDASEKNGRSLQRQITFILEKEKALSATNTQGLDVKPTQN